MKTSKIFSFSLFFVIIFSAVIVSQISLSNEQTQYSVSGTIFGPNSPYVGATVEAYLHNTKTLLATTTTNGSGNYTLSGISGEIDAGIIIYSDDEDGCVTWYPSAGDQPSSTPLNVTSNLTGINFNTSCH